jgi:D-arabinitol dehydrogenase (NADP+)
MKAVVYDGPRRFEVRDIPVPDPLPGEVRIKVNQVGVCGTDLHIHEGEFRTAYPLIPGHELVGTIDALGDQVTSFAVGMQVTVNPNLACMECEYCRDGRLILCTDLKGFGSTFPGFFADYTTAPAQLVYPVDDLDPDVAIFCEPNACASHGLDVLAMRPGSTALVIGAGPTGLLLAQGIRNSGASSVTTAATKQFKLDVAKKLGIDQTVLIKRGDPAGNLQALRQASPDGNGYDVVVEATGSPEVGEICVPLTRSGGTVLIYGVTKHADRVPISPYDVFQREITIKGSFAEVTSFVSSIRALSSGRVRTEGIISHKFSFDDYGKALDTLAHDPTAHKVVMVA